MKSVFIYNGSRSSESRSLLIINKLINHVNNLDNQIQFKYYSPLNSTINHCRGCLNCFNTGLCAMDKNDDMYNIRRDMESSDFIIFASPVYGHNVNGDMKIFLDRITYWFHYMRLMNKKGMVLVSTSTNGGEQVLSYLYRDMSHLGISVVSGYENNMIDETNINDTTLEIAQKLVAELNTPVKSNRILEEIYRYLSDNFNYEEDSIQHKFLKDKNFFEYNSYEEVLKSTI